jgi:hypothetical protein
MRDCFKSCRKLDYEKPFLKETQASAQSQATPNSITTLKTLNPGIRPKPKYLITDEDKQIINHLIAQGIKKEFPQKKFIVGGIEKHYASYLFFTDSSTNIESKSDKITYKCLLCVATVICLPAESRNVKRHHQSTCKNKLMIAA